MKKVDGILQNYIEYKKLSVHSKDKLYSITTYISLLLKRLKNIDKCTEKDLISFLNHLTNKYSVSTINDIKVFVKNFCKWYFVDYSSRFRNLDKICRNEKAPSPYTDRDILTRAEVEQLVKAEPTSYWKALFSLLYYSGSRPNEICNLKWADIDLDSEGGDAFIRIFSKKNKKTFLKNIPGNVVFYLKQIQNNSSEWVFPSPKINTKKGMPLKSKSIFLRLTTLSKKVLGKSVSAYKLRHSMATSLYNNKNLKDIDVAEHMGHSKSMREVYTHLSKDQMRENARRIWIATEELPPEKRKQLEGEISDLKNYIQHGFDDLFSTMQEIQDFGKLDIQKMRENLKKEKLKQFQSPVSG